MHMTVDSIRAVAIGAPPAAATRTRRVPAGAESEGARRRGGAAPCSCSIHATLAHSHSDRRPGSPAGRGRHPAPLARVAFDVSLHSGIVTRSNAAMYLCLFFSYEKNFILFSKKILLNIDKMISVS